MTGFNYIINLTVVNGGAFAKLAGMAQGFETTLDAIHDELVQINSKVGGLGRTGQSVFGGLRSSVMSWVTGLGIGLATLGSLQAAAQNEGLTKSIEFAGGADGAKNLAYVRSEVDRLGLPLRESFDGFKTLSGAMMGTGFAAEQQQKIFTGLAEGIATFRLPAEQSNRALLALAQMASKGTVQSEELKGQLGDALPSAFAIAARSMGVTTSALQKMLEDGDVMASDFLPKFASELHKTFAVEAVNASQGATANFHRLQNSIFDLKVMVGEQLMPVAITLIQDFLIPAANWIKQNSDSLIALVQVGALWITLTKTAVIWQGLWTLSTQMAAASQLLFAGSLGRAILLAKISSLVTGGLTGAVSALNAAFWANPIMWVVGILATLAVAIKYAWDHFSGFRGFLYGMWAAIKETGSIIYDFLIAPLMAFGKTLIGAWTFNPDMIGDGLKEGMAVMHKIIDGPSISDRLSGAIKNGWNEGVSSLNQDSAADKISAAVSPTGALSAINFSNATSDNKGAGSGGGKASKLSESITGGGQRNVTINVGKLNEGGITIHTTNLKEGSADIEAMMMKLFLQVINSANQTQGG